MRILLLQDGPQRYELRTNDTPGLSIDEADHLPEYLPVRVYDQV
jgi:hypothetical protein